MNGEDDFFVTQISIDSFTATSFRTVRQGGGMMEPCRKVMNDVTTFTIDPFCLTAAKFDKLLTLFCHIMAEMVKDKQIEKSSN